MVMTRKVSVVYQAQPGETVTLLFGRDDGAVAMVSHMDRLPFLVMADGEKRQISRLELTWDHSAGVACFIDAARQAQLVINEAHEKIAKSMGISTAGLTVARRLPTR